MRFHSLPDAKRYADDDAERHEVLRRHRVVLAELSGNTPLSNLIVVGEDFGPNDLLSGWTKRYLPRAWPWRRPQSHELADEAEGPAYVWVASGLSEVEMDTLLSATADFRATPTIVDPGFTWAYRPYDGGADVLLPTSAAREDLEQRHRDWLPD